MLDDASSLGLFIVLVFLFSLLSLLIHMDNDAWATFTTMLFDRNQFRPRGRVDKDTKYVYSKDLKLDTISFVGGFKICK